MSPLDMHHRAAEAKGEGRSVLHLADVTRPRVPEDAHTCGDPALDPSECEACPERLGYLPSSQARLASLRGADR